MKILTVDVGGTFIKFAVMNETAETFSRGKIPTPKKSHAEFLQAIFEIFQAHEVEGIGISLPGIIDAEKGFCIASAALDYNSGKNISQELKKICGVEVAIENDANCAALAESKIGSLSDVEDGFVMVFGTMIGGAFIKNKKIHRGKNFLSGEVSFMFKSFASDISDKKFFGEICSVNNLIKNFASGEEFFDAAESGNKIALQSLEKFSRQIATQIFNIQMILDPEKFALGGGISERKIFIDSVRESLKKVYAVCPVKFPQVEVVPCKFRNDANLIGALFTSLDKKNKQQI